MKRSCNLYCWSDASNNLTIECDNDTNSSENLEILVPLPLMCSINGTERSHLCKHCYNTSFLLQPNLTDLLSSTIKNSNYFCNDNDNNVQVNNSYDYFNFSFNNSNYFDYISNATTISTSTTTETINCQDYAEYSGKIVQSRMGALIQQTLPPITLI